MTLLLRQGSRAVLFLALFALLYILHAQSIEDHSTSDTYSLRDNAKKLKEFNGPAELEREDINWDQYKYVQVVSNAQDLCTAATIWAEIEKVGSRAGRIMLHPSSWVTDTSEKSPSKQQAMLTRLLDHAQQKSYVKLLPTSLLNNESSPWADTEYANLLAFNLTHAPPLTSTAFTKLLVLSPTISIHAQLDEVFLLPLPKTTIIALPHAYLPELERQEFISSIMLLTPSAETFGKISERLWRDKLEDRKSTALQILKSTFSALRIAKIDLKDYTFLTSHLRHAPPSTSQQTFYSKIKSSLQCFLADQPLNPNSEMLKARNTAKIIHFQDAGMPKPWIKASRKTINRNMPRCKRTERYGTTDCKERQAWIGAYGDYQRRREELCGADFAV